MARHSCQFIHSKYYIMLSHTIPTVKKIRALQKLQAKGTHLFQRMADAGLDSKVPERYLSDFMIYHNICRSKITSLTLKKVDCEVSYIFPFNLPESKNLIENVGFKATWQTLSRFQLQPPLETAPQTFPCW